MKINIEKKRYDRYKKLQEFVNSNSPKIVQKLPVKIQRLIAKYIVKLEISPIEKNKHVYKLYVFGKLVASIILYDV